jgi:hypothetical protein
MPSQGPKSGPKTGPKRSTRLAIVDQAIVDTLERLRELPVSPRVRELRAKAEVYERALRAWTTRPPTEEARAALLKLVLELNVQAISLSKEQRG